MTESEIAQGITIKTLKMIISLQLDHGTITKIGVLKSTGDSKLDASAVRWVKANWVFAKNITGHYHLPVEFSNKEQKHPAGK